MPIYNNILAGSSGQGGYEIEQSLRFEDGDSPYLTRQYSSAGNRKTYTLSCWVKRGALGDKRIFGADGSSNFAWVLQFDSSDKISVGAYSGGYVYQVVTTAVYRDVGAWYHIVVSTDTTQATASDRIKIYVNGKQETAFDTASYPSLNLDTSINDNTASRPHGIGYIPGSGGDYDGYLAELNVIDGQALDASNFGETNLLTNQWIPKKYVGTYGTNGFYLNFSNSASLGADSSGNGNNFTPTNLAATDQVLDSPTNNFSTFNPLWFRTSNIPTYKEGNLQVSPSSATQQPSISSFGGLKSGKWYCEFYVQALTNAFYLGAIESSARMEYVASNTAIISRIYTSSNGNKQSYPSASSVAYGATYTTGDIIGIALDLDVGELTYYKNGVSQGVAFTDLLSAMPDSGWSFFIDHSQSSNIANVNFGQDSSFAGNTTAQNNTDANGRGDFYYAPPSGYLALCEDNLPVPSIALPGDHFNTLLYTGLYGTSDSYTGVGFQPDFTWLKHRNNPVAYGNQLYDSVRGATNYLISNTNAAENDGGAPFTLGLKSFDSDGFTLGQTLTINASGVNHASWNWKADNTSGSSNTDGTITSTVSSNSTAGFSIVKYTGNATAGATVGHGLSQAPDFMLVKQLDAVKNWSVYYGDPTDYLILNGTNATADDNRFWNDTAPGASVFTLGGLDWVNASGNDYIAYCFHSVEGYSKIGSYTGNGSNDGPFIYTGFSVALLIVKEINTGVQNWYMMDNKRGTNNPVNQYLHPNVSDDENGYAQGDVFDIVDFVSNGFKIKHSRPALNQSGNTLIYMAFAESPFKYSNAR